MSETQRREILLSVLSLLLGGYSTVKSVDLEKRLQQLQSYVSSLGLKIAFTTKDVTTQNGVYCEPFSNQLFSLPLSRAIVVTYLSGSDICFETYDVTTGVENYTVNPDGSLTHTHTLRKVDTQLRIFYLNVS
jgi:hypothetical protein